MIVHYTKANGTVIMQTLFNAKLTTIKDDPQNTQILTIKYPNGKGLKWTGKAGVGETVRILEGDNVLIEWIGDQPKKQTAAEIEQELQAEYEREHPGRKAVVYKEKGVPSDSKDYSEWKATHAN